MVVTIKKVQAIGKTKGTPTDSAVKETSEVVDEVVTNSDEPMANVGLKIGVTRNIGEYESVRVDVSLFMPSKTDEKSLKKTFKRVEKWCEKRIAKVDKELQ